MAGSAGPSPATNIRHQNIRLGKFEDNKAMTETARTVTYVVVAAVSLAIAWFAAPPANITPSQLASANLGKDFFPDFRNVSDPTSIRVVSYDEATAQSRIFAVEFKDGLWTIPSHHNYPADGARMLANTAASAIGIKRDEFRSASKEDHEDLGVVDPLEADTTQLKGRGQRITLSKGDSVLLDLIIGKQVRDRPGYFYVRVPSENSTYVAKIDIKLSTKFADWVETNLLKVTRDQMSEIELNDYSIAVDARGARLVPGQITQLNRDKPADPWKLAGLDEKTEELETKKVDDMVTTLADLKLVGVRPKPKGIRADMTIDPEFVQNQLDVQLLVTDLQARGYAMAPDPDHEDQFKLYSRQGELSLATNNGVEYVLRFGEVFSGDETEIEIGGEAGKAKDAGKDPEKDKEKTADDKTTAGDTKEGKDATAGKQASRYLFVTTRFDEKYLGPKPVEPERPAGLPEEEETRGKGSKKAKPGSAPKIKPGKKSARPSAARKKKPSKPAEEDSDAVTEEATRKKVEDCGPAGASEESKDAADEKPADAVKENQDEKPEASDAPAEKAEGAEKPESADKAEPAKKPESAEKGAEKPAGEAAEKPKTPEQIKQEYETLHQKYEADLKSYEDKLKAGQEKVDELNRRFGDWYYVISAESFNKLHLSRKDLVKEKAPATTEKPPENPNPDEDKPGADAEAEKPEDAKPETEKKEADADAKPEAKPETDASPEPEAKEKP
jgi:hypothetical protein